MVYFDSVKVEGAKMQLPEGIRQSKEIVQRLSATAHVSERDFKLLCLARLRLAVWFCKQENLYPNKENLRDILGIYAERVFKCYRECVETEGVAKLGDIAHLDL